MAEALRGKSVCGVQGDVRKIGTEWTMKKAIRSLTFFDKSLKLEKWADMKKCKEKETGGRMGPDGLRSLRSTVRIHLKPLCRETKIYRKGKVSKEMAEKQVEERAHLLYKGGREESTGAVRFGGSTTEIKDGG